MIICDYLVSGPAAGWLFASFPKAFAWNSLVMAAFRLRKSQPASLACCLLLKLRISQQPSSLARRHRPAERSDPCCLPKGTGPSHHAISDGIPHPAHKSLVQWSRVCSPMCSQGFPFRLEPVIIKIIIIIAIIITSIIWLTTFSACSALLKPKCQKMSSTRCSIFSLKR